VNSCTDEDTVMVSVTDGPGSPSIPTGITERCSGSGTDTFTIPSVEDADTYQWTPDPFEAGDFTMNDTSMTVEWAEDFTGNVYVYVTAENTCGDVSSDSLEIVVYPTPDFDLGNDTTLCSGDSLNLTGPLADTYLWSNGSTDSSIWIQGGGTFWLEASLGICSAIDSLEVSISDPWIDLGPDTLFVNDFPVSLDAGTGFMEYVWNTGETTQSISVDAEGVFYVVGTNSEGCQASDTIFVADITSSVNGFKDEFSLYPNPATNVLFIESNDREANIHIYSQEGILMKNISIQPGRTSVDVSTWKPGMYMLKQARKDSVIIRKFILH
ncbi:MAG: T9SS type A sorting domain-containing protein, partial [Bacteroidota bacterium]